MIKATIIVSLSRSELLSFNPCKEGLDLFDQIAPSGSIEIEWTDLHAVWLVKATQFGPWLDQKGLIPPLRSVNWKKADLSGAYLFRADLTGANLTGADLTGANLTGAYLSEADLTETTWNQKFPVPSGWKLNENRLIAYNQNLDNFPLVKFLFSTGYDLEFSCKNSYRGPVVVVTSRETFGHFLSRVVALSSSLETTPEQKSALINALKLVRVLQVEDKTHIWFPALS